MLRSNGPRLRTCPCCLQTKLPALFWLQLYSILQHRPYHRRADHEPPHFHLQADIAEIAATTHKAPARQGPLAHLQQLWRSASSAIAHHTQGHQHQAPRSSPPAGSGGSSSGGQAGSGGPSAGEDTGGSGGSSSSRASPAAQLGNTMRGLVSWLGGDGYGDGDATR